VTSGRSPDADDGWWWSHSACSPSMPLSWMWFPLFRPPHPEGRGCCARYQAES